MPLPYTRRLAEIRHSKTHPPTHDAATSRFRPRPGAGRPRRRARDPSSGPRSRGCRTGRPRRISGAAPPASAGKRPRGPDRAPRRPAAPPSPAATASRPRRARRSTTSSSAIPASASPTRTDHQPGNDGDAELKSLYGIYHAYFVRGDLNDDGVLDFVLGFVRRDLGRGTPWFSVVVFTGRLGAGGAPDFSSGTFLERDVTSPARRHLRRPRFRRHQPGSRRRDRAAVPLGSRNPHVPLRPRRRRGPGHAVGLQTRGRSRRAREPGAARVRSCGPRRAGPAPRPRADPETGPSSRSPSRFRCGASSPTSFPPGVRPCARGSRVRVPFGERALTGVVVSASGPSAPGMREILEVLDPEPVCPADLLDLARRTAARFFASTGRS